MLMKTALVVEKKVVNSPESAAIRRWLVTFKLTVSVL